MCEAFFWFVLKFYLGMFLGGAAEACQPQDQACAPPCVAATCDCKPCKPCCCKDKCECPECHCEQCPAKVSGTAAVVPPPLSSPVPPCCAMPCPAESPWMSYPMCIPPAMPAMPEPMPVPNSAPCMPVCAPPGAGCQYIPSSYPVVVSPAVYKVEARLMGGVFGCPHDGIALPPVQVGEHSCIRVALEKKVPGSKVRVHSMDIYVRGQGKSKAVVGVGLNTECEQGCPGTGHYRGCRESLLADHTVKLGKVCGVELTSCQPSAEPCWIEVKVTQESPALECMAIDFARPVCPPSPAACIPCCPPPPLPAPATCIASLPMPTPLPAPAVAPCTYATAQQTGSPVICRVEKDGKSRLQMKATDGTCTTCGRTEMKAGSCAVVLAAGKKQVVLHGKGWKASADQVQVMSQTKTAVLTGHVKLTADRAGVSSATKGERLCVSIEDGKVMPESAPIGVGY